MNMEINLCRICMQDMQDSKILIYRTEVANDLVANLIIDLADVECSYDDTLPDAICEVCVEGLEKAYEFRKMIRKSDVLLREMFDEDRVIKQEDAEEQEEEVVTVSPPAKYSLSIKQVKSIPDKSKKTTTNNNQKQSTSFEHEMLESIKESFSTDEHDEEESNASVKDSDDDDEDVPDWVLFKKQKLAEKANVPAQEVTKDPKICCCMCPIIFENEEAVIEHARSEHKIMPQDVDEFMDGDQKVVQCKVCLKQFQSFLSMHAHRLRFTTMVQCPVCGVLVAKKRATIHARIHEDKSVECDICGIKLKNSRMLKPHRKMHVIDGHYQCNECPKEFDNELAYQRHMTHHRYRKKPFRYSCEQCNKGFRSPGQLRNHMRIHTGEKPFACQYCEQAFTHKTDHRRHEWQHTGSPYVCKGCSKDFQRPSHLRTHESACNKFIELQSDEVTEILYYECGECAEKYATEADFAEHIATHH